MMKIEPWFQAFQGSHQKCWSHNRTVFCAFWWHFLFFLIEKDKTLLLIIIFFLSEQLGLPHKRSLHIFLLWGMTEMQWLQYTQSPNFYQMKSHKNTKIVSTCKKFCFLTWSPKIVSYLHFCMESPPAERVCTISQSISISKITLAWTINMIFCCWSWILA